MSYAALGKQHGRSFRIGVAETLGEAALEALTKEQRLTALERTKHPLVVLVVATILGSVLIPYANGRFAKDSRLHDLKVSHAKQALQSASLTDRRLNLLLTEFAIFIKGESRNNSAARSALRERVYTLYAEFNRDAWWWYWPMMQEARLLHLVDEEAARSMGIATEAYAANLQESTTALDPLWALLLTDATRPTPRDAAAVLASSTSRLMELQSARQEIIGRMVAPLTK